jgi:phosphoglycerate dehydrogenase-like enzyme
VLDRAPGLRLVCVVGPWTDRIDLDAAGRLGICVTNTPGAAVPAVAEMTLALMLALLRPIPTLPPVASPDGWRPPLGRELCGKHLGLLGLGAIGSAVARLARALGMTVSAWSPALTPERAEAHGARARPLPEILEEADVVSLHLRWGARTARVLDREAIGRLQRTAVLVNTSRAALVDEDALYEALSQRRIAGAALDVHGREPLPEDSRWRRLPNVLLTPHCAWSTGEAVDRMVEMAAGNALAFLRGAPRHVVKAA